MMALACATVAQDFPARPLRLIVASGAGGGTDLQARLVGPFLAKYLPGSPKMVSMPLSFSASMIR